MKLDKADGFIGLGAILIFILYRSFFYHGHFGYDDLWYAELANNLNHGFIDNSDHYALRWPIIFLTALSYRIFGINDFASSLPSIFIAVSTIFTTLTALPNFSVQSKIISVALIVFNPWFLFYSDKLMPDIYIAFAAAAFFVIYGNYRYHPKQGKPALYALGMSSVFFFGFLSKGTIILLIPAILGIFVLDLFFKKNLKIWWYTALFTLLFFVAYLFYFKLAYGDFFYRLKAIEANSYLNLCSYADQPIQFVLKRISYILIMMFINTGLFLPIALSLGYFRVIKFKELFRLTDSGSFYLLTTILLGLSSNFMSISLKHYNPMCTDPRHYLFVVPIVAITVGHLWQKDEFSLRYRFLPSVGVIFLCFITMSLLQGYLDKWMMFLPMLSFMGVLIIEHFNSKKFFILPLLVLGLATPVVPKLIWAKQVNYPAQKEFAHNLLHYTDAEIIVSDTVQCKLLNYYTEFEMPQRFYNYQTAGQYSTSMTYPFLFIYNPHTLQLTGRTKDDLPFWVKYVLQEQTLMYTNDRLNLKSYLITEIPQKSELQKHPLYTNLAENFPNGTSPLLTLELNQDSIMHGMFLEVKGSLSQLELEDLSLEIKIEHRNGEPDIFTTDLGKFNKALDNWWSFWYEVYLHAESLEDSPTIYLNIVNEGREVVSLKDVEIMLSAIR